MEQERVEISELKDPVKVFSLEKLPQSETVKNKNCELPEIVC